MSTGKPKIYQDIEATADYYPPGLYAGLGTSRGGFKGLLSYYHDLTVDMVPESTEFIPLTAARTRNPQADKVFAIGVIPPSANVTGKILDRSASYQRGEDAPVSITGPEAMEIERQASIPGGVDCPAQAGESFLGGTSETAFIDDFLMSPADGVAEKYWFSQRNVSFCCNIALAMLRRCGLSNEILDGRTVTGHGCNNIRKIGNQYDALVPGSSSEMPQRGDVVYYKYELQGEAREAAIRLGRTGEISRRHAFVVASVSGNTIRSVDGGSSKNSTFSMSRTFTKKEDGYWYTLAPMSGIPARIEYWVNSSKLPFGGTGQVPGDAGQGDWKENGSQDAQTARKEEAKSTGASLTKDQFGQALYAAQRQQIADTQAAIEAMKNTPPLRLIVNPRQFAVKGTKITQDGNWGRNGPIIEHWGHEQDTISASGRVAGFYAVDRNNATGPGLTRGARHFSQAWANLMSLYLLYKNNGGVYLRDYLDGTKQLRNLSLVGSIYIYYDGILYIGSFSSFNLTEEESAPFTVEYSFEFTVRAAFMLDRPDPRYDVTRDYGEQRIAGLPPTSTAVEDLGEPQPGTSEQAGEQRRTAAEEFGTTGELTPEEEREREAQRFVETVRGGGGFG